MVLRTLREAKSKLESYVLQGQLPDFPTYRYFTGEIKGLQDAIDIYQSIIKGEEDDL